MHHLEARNEQMHQWEIPIPSTATDIVPISSAVDKPMSPRWMNSNMYVVCEVVEIWSDSDRLLRPCPKTTSKALLMYGHSSPLLLPNIEI